MATYINLILAWVTVTLAVLCTAIWLLRLIHKRWYPGQKNALYRVNRLLRRPHKWLGISMVISGGIHGLLSTEPLLGWNLGTLCWALCIGIGVTYLLRKKLPGPSWMVWHRAATIALVCVLGAHIIHTGIQIDDVFARERDEIVAAVDPDRITDYLRENPPGGISAQPSAAPSDTPAIAAPADGAWKDGEYIGTGTGLRPGLRVRVTIEAGRIASVEVIEHHERDRRYWGRPVSLLPQLVIDAQSADVDTVTGATMTSRGIIEAVRDALSQAAANV